MKKLFIILTIIFSKNAFAQDMYLEYKMSGIRPGMETTSKMYVSSSAGVRTEADMEMPKMGKMSTVTIMPKGKNTVYTYNSMSKSYYETSTTADPNMAADMKFELVGKEKVGPYNCTHIKMLLGNKLASDMWITKDIPGYEVMETLTKSTSMFGNSKLYNQIKAAGADGLTVKMVLHLGSGKDMTTQLVKAEKHANPASMFVVPAGYTKAELPKMPAGYPKR